jgi:hypothetical protein
MRLIINLDIRMKILEDCVLTMDDIVMQLGQI